MGSKNAGDNRSKSAAAEISAAEKAVNRTAANPNLRTGTAAGDRRLQREISKGPRVGSSQGDIKNRAGDVLRQSYQRSDLGRMGIDPRMIASSGDPFRDNTLTGNELRQIGRLRDLSPNEQRNRFFGLNPTTSMGIMEGLKNTFGNIGFQRDLARAKNSLKTGANMMPGTNIARSLSNSLFGTDFSPFEMSNIPVGFIDPRFGDFYNGDEEALNPNLRMGTETTNRNFINSLSDDQLGFFETYSDPTIANRLFNQAPEQVAPEQVAPEQVAPEQVAPNLQPFEAIPVEVAALAAAGLGRLNSGSNVRGRSLLGRGANIKAGLGGGLKGSNARLGTLNVKPGGAGAAINKPLIDFKNSKLLSNTKINPYATTGNATNAALNANKGVGMFSRLSPFLRGAGTLGLAAGAFQGGKAIGDYGMDATGTRDDVANLGASFADTGFGQSIAQNLFGIGAGPDGLYTPDDYNQRLDLGYDPFGT